MEFLWSLMGPLGNPQLGLRCFGGLRVSTCVCFSEALGWNVGTGRLDLRYLVPACVYASNA